MKNKLSILTAVFALIWAGNIGASPMEQGSKGSMMNEGKAVGQAVEVGNKVCPISGEKVDDHGKPTRVEYKGKVYNLCCAMCKKDFLKDPEKYIKKIKETEGLE